MEVKKNSTNALTYKTKIDSQTEKTNLWLQRWNEGRDKLGVKHQGPTVEHRELYSIHCNTL